eukprot:Nitzschia sp. Nitz4//scaffold63_size106090//79714//80226//NITZ4_004405-RA/size106090-processed-gene-0.91-mRNA-1//-1//CDS//3329556020//1868//frame0
MSEVQESETSQIRKSLEDTTISGTSATVSLPVPTCLPSTLSRSYKIDGVVTDAWVQIFAERIVVGVSQRDQKIANWCLCQAMQSEIDPKSIDFQINTLLGDRNDAMIGVYARRIVERITQDGLVPGSNAMVVLLGISLANRNPSPQVFAVIIDTLLSLIRDALAQMKSME